MENELPHLSNNIINLKRGEFIFQIEIVEIALKNKYFYIINNLIKISSEAEIRELFMKGKIFILVLGLLDHPEDFSNGLYILSQLQSHKLKQKYAQLIIAKFENLISEKEKTKIISYSINPFQICVFISIILLEISKKNTFFSKKIYDLAIRFRLNY